MGIEGPSSPKRRELLKAITAVTALGPLSIDAEAAPKKPSASLKGSRKSQERQNNRADDADLSRIENDEQLRRFIERGLLVPLSEDRTIRIDPRLQERFRYARPWTREYLQHVARDFYKQFGKPIQINSAVRTVDSQKILRKTNPNAASTEGPKRSSHLTGATIDIAKIGMKDTELNWIRNRLLLDEGAGKVEATEERMQLVFHIMVFKNYKK